MRAGRSQGEEQPQKHLAASGSGHVGRSHWVLRPVQLTRTAACRIVRTMKSDTHTAARLEARLPHDVLVRLKRAAEIQGRTLTDFVVAAADEAACRAIEQSEIIRLSVEDQRHIAAALFHPPAPTAALRKAVKRYRNLFGAE